QNLARKEKEAKEERLRMLAQRAREERAAAAGNRQPVDIDGPRQRAAAERTPARNATPDSPGSRSPSVSPHRANRPSAASFFNDKSRSPSPAQRARRSRYEDSDDEKEPSRKRSRSPVQRAGRSRYDDSGDEKEAARARKRDELRRELRKQNERELRLSRMGNEAKAKYLRKNESRDISERIALGMAKPTASREGLFDSRLFNQPSASNAALQDEEAYNLYDKPLFNTKGRGVNSYRPRAIEEESKAAAEADRLLNSDRFGNALSGFKGSKKDSNPRSGPVEFEKDDVFGIDAFADKAKQSKQ
ncbi:mRNA splicing protein, partial [Linderina pennispora]